MSNWTKTQKPDFMNVAYCSERSIEDELDRESRSDILTILVSYLIMFAYIALSLGQIRKFSSLLVIKTYFFTIIKFICGMWYL